MLSNSAKQEKSPIHSMEVPWKNVTEVVAMNILGEERISGLGKKISWNSSISSQQVSDTEKICIKQNFVSYELASVAIYGFSTMVLSKKTPNILL
jgi:hypothetical protein